MIIENTGLKRFESFFLILLAVLTISSFFVVNSLAFQNFGLRVFFLDVGQGDAIFIEAANGNQILIDGGPDNKILSELPKVMPVGDRSIDLVVLTHPDADHLNGLIEVLRRYDVGQVLENQADFNNPAYAVWDKLKNEKTEVARAKAGQVINIDRETTMLILYPFADEQPDSKNNNNSIVAKLIYGNFSVLFPGDIETKLEKKLIGQLVELDSDFLKLAHHGSKTSTTEEFLDLVSPEAVFISVAGKNSYGHPSPLVIDRLEKRQIKYYRTDKEGSIKLEFGNSSYQISSEKIYAQ
jgi:competence protein ComEC